MRIIFQDQDILERFRNRRIEYDSARMERTTKVGGIAVALAITSIFNEEIGKLNKNISEIFERKWY